MEDLFLCDEWKIEVKLQDENDQPLDLTGKNLFFLLAPDLKNKPEIQQSFNIDPDPTTGIATIEIQEEKTSKVSSGLNWVCFVLDESGAEKTIFQERVQIKRRLKLL